MTSHERFVLSGKREEWTSHVLDDFTTQIGAGAASDLEHNDTILQLTAQIALLNATITSMQATLASATNDSDADTMAVAAIVVTIVTTVILTASFLALNARFNTLASSTDAKLVQKQQHQQPLANEFFNPMFGGEHSVAVATPTMNTPDDGHTGDQKSFA
jgi:hypothetical protein